MESELKIASTPSEFKIEYGEGDNLESSITIFNFTQYNFWTKKANQMLIS